LAFKTKAFFDSARKHEPKEHSRLDDVLIFFEDLLFALISSVVICVFIYYMNSGQFRGLAFVGVLLGFLLYYLTVGKLMLYLFGLLIGFLKFLTIKIYDYTLRPVKKGVIFILRHTFAYWYLLLMAYVYKKTAINSASVGFNVLDTIKKGRNRK
jgi:hypothetical protein